MEGLILICAILVFFVACFIKFLHYIIGSPKANEYETGRIFSIYGRFVTNHYVKYHNLESKRIWAKYKEIEYNLQTELEHKLEGATANEKAELHTAYSAKIEEALDNMESWRKPNPFLALGACFVCFSTWVACFAWIVLIPYFALPLLLFPFVVSATVLVGNRIDM